MDFSARTDDISNITDNFEIEVAPESYTKGIYTVVGTYGGCIQQYSAASDTWYTRVENESTVHETLFRIHGTPDGQYLMAGGRNTSARATAVYSADGGRTWHDAISGFPGSSVTQAAEAIYVVSPTEAYCWCNASVPSQRGIYRWNGSSWTHYYSLFDSITRVSDFLKVGNYLYICRCPTTGGSNLYRYDGITLEADSSLPTITSGGGFFGCLIPDSNGDFYILRHETDSPYCQVWKGQFNNFVMDYDGMTDQAQADSGYPRMWVSPTNTVYFVYQGPNTPYTPKNYIAKRNPNTGTWSSTYLGFTGGWGTADAFAIHGKKDSDIFISAGKVYTWNEGHGYYQRNDGTGWVLEQNSDYTRVGPQMQMESVFPIPYWANPRNNNDVLSATDNLGVALHYERSCNEVVGTLDELSTESFFDKKASDSLHAVDSVAHTTTYSRKTSDTIYALDSVGFLYERDKFDTVHAVDHGTLHPLISRISGTAVVNTRSRKVSAVIGCGGAQDFVAASSDTQITVDLLQADAVLESLTLDPFLCDATNCWQVTFSVPAPQNFMVRVTLTGKKKVGCVILPVVFTQELVPSVLSTLRKPR